MDLCLNKKERMENIYQERGFKCLCERCDSEFDDTRRVI